MNAPPHSLEAERSLLGCVLTDDVRLGLLELTAPEFYHPGHRFVFAAMRELAAKGVRIDAVTLMDKIGGQGGSAVDGIFVSELLSSSFVSDNIHYYEEIIRAKARSRKIISAATDIVALGLDDPGDDYPDVAAQMFSAAASSASDKGLRSILDVAKETHRHVFDRIEGRTSPGVPTGYADLDAVLQGGLQFSDLVIAAGRPSMGKTALALGATFNAASSGFPALFFSLEMNRRQLCERMAAIDAEIDMNLVKSGRASREEIGRFSVSIDKIAALPITIDDSSYLTIQDLLSRARRWAIALRDRPKLIVVDYLQLLRVKGSPKDGSREREVATISGGLKQIAKELDCPVLALSQLNRGLEHREDKRPMMSDLRESGAIEQDADVVMFVYRDVVYNPTAPKDHAELLIRKHRNGKNPVDIFMKYEDLYTKFSTREPDDF